MPVPRCRRTESRLSTHRARPHPERNACRDH
jgi:hypothetical protein